MPTGSRPVPRAGVSGSATDRRPAPARTNAALGSGNAHRRSGTLHFYEEPRARGGSADSQRKEAPSTMLSGRTSLAFGLIALGFFPAALRGAGDDYRRAVLALNPDHYYPLEDTELGEPMLDDNGDPIPVPGGFLYEGIAEDIGKSPDL